MNKLKNSLFAALGVVILVAALGVVKPVVYHGQAPALELWSPSAVDAQPPEKPGLAQRVAALEALVAQLQADLAAVEPLEDLARFITVVNPTTINGLAGPHIIFEGVNVHVRSGSGCTNDGDPIAATPCDPATIALTGLGNLVVGYDEEPPGLLAGDRGGSHNLIIGPEHRVLSFGGLVAGRQNTIGGKHASVAGGDGNAALSDHSAILGGDGNTTMDVGGPKGSPVGLAATVSGGSDNVATGNSASVSGGALNMASGNIASVSGGSNNVASAAGASVSGGKANLASNDIASVSGGRSNVASGQDASVIGGRNNEAGGEASVVLGGNGNSTFTADDIVP